MTKTLRLAAIGVLLLAALPLTGQQQPAIDYAPVSCIRSREFTVLFASTDAKGDARLYFRPVGATEWCYVEGVRLPASNRFRAILPKFEHDTEIEHFFITVDNGEVTARTPRLYRVRAQDRCDAVIGRGVDFLLNSCESGPGELGSAVAAGYAIQSNVDPQEVSPSTPE
jgi:hypothetical protein